MTKFSSFNRKDIFKRLVNNPLDLLIIGGGITGAGIALDAVTRGLKVGLVEMQDFAGGTSSRSTKLVHGGLRYLQQFEIKMVAEIGKEREIVYENGPHVTTPEWMMLPFHKGSSLGPFTTNIGLRVYDFLAGVKKSERRKMFSPKEALAKEPLIKQDGLLGAGYYVEYKTDDARLTIEVLKKAVESGALAVNYAMGTEFVYDESGRLSGLMVKDNITGDAYKLHAKKIINAGGPWVDELREMDGSKKGKTLHLTKGIHLVFSKEVFPLQQAIYFDAPDGRMIFAIPRDGKTYVGTTDTTYEGDIAHPVMTEADENYVLQAIHYMFPSLKITKKQVESSWAGIRPLIEEEGKNSPSEISRKDEIFISDSGLLSMAGGKLTGYRKMAEQAIDTIVKQLQAEEGVLYSKSETIHLPISGGDVDGSKGFVSFKQQKIKEAIAIGMEETLALDLIDTYGSNVDTLFNIYQERKEDAMKENIDVAVFTKLIYALEYEAAYKPVDFFIRRTGALFFDIDWVKANKDQVAHYMAKVLEWNAVQAEKYLAELEQLMEEAVTPA